VGAEHHELSLDLGGERDELFGDRSDANVRERRDGR
jgi:hypothetical protein